MSQTILKGSQILFQSNHTGKEIDLKATNGKNLQFPDLILCKEIQGPLATINELNTLNLTSEKIKTEELSSYEASVDNIETKNIIIESEKVSKSEIKNLLVTESLTSSKWLSFELNANPVIVIDTNKSEWFGIIMSKDNEPTGTCGMNFVSYSVHELQSSGNSNLSFSYSDGYIRVKSSDNKTYPNFQMCYLRLA